MEQKPVTAMSIKMIAKITSYEDGELCGILDSIYFKEPLCFTNVVNMIAMMETTYDALGFPDKAMLPRTFGKAKARMRKNEMDIAARCKAIESTLKARSAGTGSIDPKDREVPQSDALAAFEIFVGFRNNAEWQGKLHWVDKGITKEFKGIVNMVKLIDEALNSLAP